MMQAKGRIEYDYEVIHVIASHLEDASHKLTQLSEDGFAPSIARADRVD